MNGTSGLSAGDILAMTRDNGAFDWSWIIGLIVVGGLFGNGSTTITVGSLSTVNATDTQIPIVKNSSLIIKKIA